MDSATEEEVQDYINEKSQGFTDTLFQLAYMHPVMKVGHKGLNLWAISYSKGGWLLKLQDCVELDV